MTCTTRMLILSCVITFTFFHSCKQAEIAENITLTVDFIIQDEDMEFESVVLVNAYDESQVLRNYKDNITGINIRNIIYYMTYYTGPASQQFNSADLEVTGPDGTEPELLGSISNEILQNILYEKKKLTLQTEGLKKLEDLIKDGSHEFRLRFDGVSNMVPNKYTLTMDIELQMTAIPL